MFIEKVKYLYSHNSENFKKKRNEIFKEIDCIFNCNNNLDGWYVYNYNKCNRVHSNL